MEAERFGVRWGLAGGVAIATMDEAREVALYAQNAGFDGLWISHAGAIHPVVALSALGEVAPDLIEFGTSVIPIFGRHPVDVAQQALSAQSILDGRFTLGIGAGSKAQAEDRLGLSWDKPFSYTREFVDVLAPLLKGQSVHFEGEHLTARTELGIKASPPPILVAALGPRMLRFAGERTAGTSLGQCGPKTIAEYVLPHLIEGAERGGHSEKPRIMALVRVCVTDDHEPAYALAKEISAFYQSFPSYQRVLAKEGLDHPADLHLIGSAQQVLDGLEAYAKAGVTDLRVEVSAPCKATIERTRGVLADHLGGRPGHP